MTRFQWMADPECVLQVLTGQLNCRLVIRGVEVARQEGSGVFPGSRVTAKIIQNQARLNETHLGFLRPPGKVSRDHLQFS